MGFVDLWDGGICGMVGFVDLRDGGVCGMEMNKKSGGGDVRAIKSPSETAYRGQLQASERRSLKRCLEPVKAKAMSLGGSVVASISQVGTRL